jgi:large subunit ribosomal protein L1
MSKRGKKYASVASKIDKNKKYTVDEAIEFIKSNPSAKFDESFEISMNLGIDPRKSDQNIRGTVSLPHGTGKSVRVLVLAKTPKDKEALDAGADYAGLEEYVEKIKSGWADVDVVVATPDVTGEVGKLGRILGPRGLMPNPKVGTVTFDVAKAVEELKAGKIEYRVDKSGNIAGAVGKCTFTKDALKDNVNLFYETIVKSRPSSAKGKFVRSVYFSSTMGPSLNIEESSFK